MSALHVTGTLLALWDQCQPMPFLEGQHVNRIFPDLLKEWQTISGDTAHFFKELLVEPDSTVGRGNGVFITIAKLKEL